MTEEHKRLKETKTATRNWKKWGPYLTERQWGTVREDYSPYGNAWEYLSHDAARSKAYRWGEEGIAGISDDNQLLCFSIGLWNGKDPILKERMFGLTGNEGNHGEDVKELYYYLDSTPTHSYMKMLYKYPLSEFPYARLVEENKRRGKNEPEFELIDTGIFNEDNYVDVFVEYAKAAAEDLLVRITLHNRGPEDATIHLLPQLWFRNTWSWGYNDYKPSLRSLDNASNEIDHKDLGRRFLFCDGAEELIFCDNDTNVNRLYGVQDAKGYFKDGVNDYIVYGNTEAVNPAKTGTKAAAQFLRTICGAGSVMFLV